MFKVVCVGAFHRKGIKLLESRPDLVTYEVLTDLSPENVARGVAGADAVVVRTTPLPRETLERADRLRIVSRHGVGTDNVDVAYLSSRKIPMAIAIDSNVGSVAEHTLMMLLALAKDAMAGDRATRSGDFAWRDRRTASDVAGKSALIMGFGRIGQRVGALCRALGLRVAAFDPYMERSPVEGVEMVKDFRAILPETDFLCLHLPSTPETRDLIGAGELALPNGEPSCSTARAEESLTRTCCAMRWRAGISAARDSTFSPRSRRIRRTACSGRRRFS